MDSNKLYTYKDKLIDGEHYARYILLLKLLYRLEIIEEKMVIDSVMEFVSLCV